MKNREEYMEALHSRHATKLFDTTKSIDEDDLTYILEAGRLSPSSFGIEPWQFLVVQDDSLKKKLQDASFSQEQIGTASAVVVVLARKDLHINDGYVEKLLRREGDEFYENFAKDFYSGYTNSLNEEQILNYADKQCYLASMNLMNAASILGIDSCPVGGFDSDKVSELCKIDSKKYAVSLVIPFGYAQNKIPIKHRRVFNEVVKYL